MKKVMKSVVVALAMALSLSLGVGATANAATTVKSVESKDNLTGNKSITLTKGKTATLKTTVKYSNGSSKTFTKKSSYVTFKSSNVKVAKVTKKGVITAVKKGTAKITVTSKKKNAKGKKVTAKKITVKVVNGKVKKVKMNKSKASTVAGGTIAVQAKVTASKGANKVLKWTSSDTDVARVVKGKKDGKATITAVGAGVAIITAQSTDGTNKKATIKVLVKGTTIKLAKDKDITGKFTLKPSKELVDDFNSIVTAAGLAEDASIKLTVNGKEVTKTVKAAREFITKNNDKATTVTVTLKAADAENYGIEAILLAPLTSIQSVEVEGVTFSEITATTFKANDKTYTYHVIDKNTIVVDDHVADDFVKITAITATNNDF